MCHLIMHEMLTGEKRGFAGCILIWELGLMLPMRNLTPMKVLAAKEACLA